MKKILLVEDDPSVRLLITEMFPAPSYEITLAKDGLEGLSQVREGGFDLVLLDIMLPVLDGIGILKELQNSPSKKRNAKIILFSSLHDDPAIKEGLALGADGYIVKSDIPPELIVEKIVNYLQ